MPLRHSLLDFCKRSQAPVRCCLCHFKTVRCKAPGCIHNGSLHAPLTIRQLSVCSAHTYLFQSLLFLSAIIFYTLIIIKVAFGNVNVKFALPTISACRRLYGGFSCPERLFRSVHALSVFHKEPFLKFPSFSQPAVYFHALSVILPE